MATAFGPWEGHLDPGERVARLRALRALACIYARYPDFIIALAKAENDPAELDRAGQLLDRLPALGRRRLLSVYARVARPIR